MPLLRQRTERLGQQGQLADTDGNLALLRAEYLALDADDIADIHLLVRLVLLIAQYIAADYQLDASVAVHHIRERHLAHDALAHHTTCETDNFALHLVVVSGNVGGVVRTLKLYLNERIHAGLTQSLQLLAADRIFLGFRTNRLLILRLLILLCHLFSFLLYTGQKDCRRLDTKRGQSFYHTIVVT